MRPLNIEENTETSETAYVYVYMYMYIYVCVRARMYICTCIHVCISRTRTHIYKYVYILASLPLDYATGVIIAWSHCVWNVIAGTERFSRRYRRNGRIQAGMDGEEKGW